MKKLVVMAVFATAGIAIAEAPPPDVSHYPWFGADFEAKAAAALARGRKPASAPAALTESNAGMSESLMNIRDRIIGNPHRVNKATGKPYEAVKSPEEVHSLLMELDRNYDSLPPDAQFVAAQIIPLRTMRGMVQRVVPMIQKTGGKVAHSMLLATVRGLAAGLRVYFPEQSAWDAGFRYVTEPASGLADFDNVVQLQAYLSTVVYRDVLKTAERIEKLDFAAKSIVLDNRIFYGPRSFADDLERFVRITEAERLAVISGLNAGLASLAGASAYRVQGSLRLMQKLGLLYGFDVVAPWDELDGAPAAEIVNKIKSEGGAVFTLLPHGREWLAISFKHVQQSVKAARLVWNQIKSRTREDDRQVVFNPAQILPFQGDIEASLTNVEAMLKGRTQIRSAITGEVVAVDIPMLFTRPVADLKSYLPTGFEGYKLETRGRNAGKFVQHKGASVVEKNGRKFKNYFVGRPTEWNVQAFQASFLPEAKSSQDVESAARVLTMVAGPWGVAIPGLVAAQAR